MIRSTLGSLSVWRPVLPHHRVVEARVDGHELHRRLSAAAAQAGGVAHAVAAVVGVQAQRPAPERRQVRVVRWRADGHRSRAPAEQVAHPASESFSQLRFCERPELAYTRR